MSLLNVRVAPRTEPAPKPPRRLRPVSAPSGLRRPKLAYAALAVGGALAIGAAQIGISLASTQDAFVLAKLNGQQHELTLQKQALGDEVAGLNSPQALASKADSMGLVVVGSASYLRLSDGAVLGAGSGASWISTVAPNSSTKVGNALLAPPPAPKAEQMPADSTAQHEPDLPPVISDGLPSPTTR
ncbi:hypothetical protein [Microbacterium suwonense]|uniref:Cell division protein FtsL n=1 Tax=Microbacterium suwonense TaxID=683047 RepID=A0ABM8FR02_9MICO|nr:hypothetical protein [Microbacterium suwonense]BDZ37892.1 hypothetical protein GCM10025863_05060 [Microbacterium suwonense]